MQLDLEVDKLTNSLEDATTGEVLLTQVLPLEKADLKLITTKMGWNFNWKTEFYVPEKQIYKLIIETEPETIQGLICLEKRLGHIFIHLIETAPHNFGKTKKYLGVAGNLVAFVCKISYEIGFDGYVSFKAKTKLIEHYSKTLGAKVLYDQYMEIATSASIKLIKDYFPDFFNK
jgi:hypothetical protein